jgi:hypothetical protein
MALRDPRQIITPDAFTVAPELLGIGLARPSRRLIAIAIDGILIAILSKLGGAVLLALGAAVLLWRASTSPKTGRDIRSDGTLTEGMPKRGLLRIGLRIASVIALGIFVLTAVNWISDRAKDLGNEIVVNAASSSDSSAARANKLGFGLRDLPMLAVLDKLREADDSLAAVPHADSLARWLSRKPIESRGTWSAILYEEAKDADGLPALRASINAIAPDTTARANAAAADSIVDPVQRELAQLRAANAALETANDTLVRAARAAAEADEEGFSVGRIFKSISDVLGFGLGWTALYFTAFTMLMRGQTPGKKLLGLRVIRLDGRPITGWIAFERFGGYAASAATGLLGFAQILWDRNRQGIHDKVAETVVIRERNGVPTRPLDGIGGEHVRPFRAPPN